MADKVFKVILLDSKKSEVYSNIRQSVMGLVSTSDEEVEEYLEKEIENYALSLFNTSKIAEYKKNVSLYTKIDVFNKESEVK